MYVWQVNEIIAWLGRSFLIKTFDNEEKYDVSEIQSLLDEDALSYGQE